MRVAALLVGGAGGVAGLASVVVVLTARAHSRTLSPENSQLLLYLALAGVGFSLLGLAGAALALRRPGLASPLLLAAGIGYSLALSYAAILATPLLMIAGLLASLGRDSGPPAPADEPCPRCQALVAHGRQVCGQCGLILARTD